MDFKNLFLLSAYDNSVLLLQLVGLFAFWYIKPFQGIRFSWSICSRKVKLLKLDLHAFQGFLLKVTFILKTLHWISANTRQENLLNMVELISSEKVTGVYNVFWDLKVKDLNLNENK